MPGGGASPKGNLYVSIVKRVGELGEAILGKRAKNDFAEARSQLYAAQQVVNDIQFGLNAKVFTSSDMPNLSKFANYVLDGEMPTITHTSLDKNGNEISSEVTDTKMVSRFDEIRTQISEKKRESNQSDQCIPCMKK